MRNGGQLPLERCPYCEIAKPLMHRIADAQTQDFVGLRPRSWQTYRCASCGGVVLTVAPVLSQGVGEIAGMWPAAKVIADELPERGRDYLKQAISSRSAPSGAVMLAASAVDSMLKDKGYKVGNLNSRIDAAAKDHLITQEMAAWAHEIRLDANDQRHADEAAPMATQEDADKVIQFAEALGQFLYVLPALVTRGRKQPPQAAPAAAKPVVSAAG